jgi:hypothetical protein
MKKGLKNSIIIIAGCVVIAGLLYGCSKNYLDKEPLGALSQASLANNTGVEGLLIGAYSMLDGQGGAAGTNWGNAVSNWVFGSVVADDSYKGSTPSDQGDVTPLETWSKATAGNPYVHQKWQALYDGIQRSNEVLRVMRLATDLTLDTTEITAEVRFLRGLYHFDAKKMWNMVPYVDENVLGTSPLVGNSEDIWSKIEADFQFAIDNLPETQAEAGRANKWAAVAFLAKVYMFEHKYDQAKTLLDQLITSGKTAQGAAYDLGTYQSNFNPAQKNGPESVFACQMSVNDGSGTNGNYGDNLNFPNNGAAAGGCCGFNCPSINLADAYKTDANGLPLLDGSYNSGLDVSNPTNPYTGTLDPRVDWAIGRPGVPYLDWGPHGGADWVRDPTDGYFSPKKNVYAKSQQGSLSSTETSFWAPTQMTANNYTFIRFADVLLWAAECEIETPGGDPAKALDYVNRVRDRIAAHPETYVYKNSDFDAATYTYKTTTTPAANYKIGLYPAGAFSDKDYARKAIQFERRLELSMEGHRFFDLQRWDSDPNHLVDMAATLNAYQAVEKTRPSLFSLYPSAQFTKGVNEFYPLPQNEVDVANAAGTQVLIQNPGY